jgi:hypothetical protein
MSAQDLATMALELPPDERLDMARRLVESVVTPVSSEEAIAEGIRRIENAFTGKTTPLTEAEFRAALG